MNQALGREAMVKNLLSHLGPGGSAVAAGGPRMGKTTFLHQIAAAGADAFRVIQVDFATGPRPDPAHIKLNELSGGASAMHCPVLLLIDGCERLLPDPAPFINGISQAVRHSEMSLAGGVWAGDARWGEWAMANQPAFTDPVRYYPLIVLPPKEARLFLKCHWSDDVPLSELEWVAELSGGHPYLLARMVEGPKRDFDTFFAELWSAADSPAERDVIAQLVQAKTWVELQDLKDDAGGRVPKSVLDRLAVVGLINRTLIDGAAVAAAVSPLLGDWVRRTEEGIKGRADV
ncbi:MAG TPA: hypothetical protein VML36_10545 [Nitrospiria bacterium]|nr:hypothetical protein [Nitrospiria bacterium]